MSIERLGWAAVAVALLSIWSNTAFTVASGNVDMAEYAARYLGYFRMYAPWMFLTTITCTIADALPLQGVRRVGALVVALALGCWGGQLATSALECMAAGCYQGPTLFSRGQVLFMLDQLPHTFGQASAFALVYFSWRRDAEVAAALHASEVARVEAERERVDSALHAMQARVEPAFLVATLRDIGERGEVCVTKGVQLLDLLIQYLRAALPPRVRRKGSTFGREGALAQAYLDMCALRTDGALAVACRFDDALADAAFPPMVLGPLVAAAAPPPVVQGALDIVARSLDDRVRVSLTAHGDVAARLAGATAIADVRERLEAIHGARASFVADRTAPDTLAIIVEIPLEPAGLSQGRDAPERAPPRPVQ